MKPIFLILAAALPAHAAVLYSESFTHAGGAVEVTTATVGWTSYYTASALVIPSPTATPRAAIGNQIGTDAGAGYLFSQGNGTSHPYVAFESNAFSILPTDITTITFKQGNNNTGLLTRLMVQQGGNWYATSSTFATAAMDLPTFQGGSAELESFTFSLTSTFWNAVTITPNSTLSMGSVIGTDLSSTLPITSIGFYMVSQSAVTRIDEVKINGIPEPTSLLLGAFAAFGVAGRRRKN